MSKAAVAAFTTLKGLVTTVGAGSAAAEASALAAGSAITTGTALVVRGSTGQIVYASDGFVILPVPGETTTVLGRYASDMNSVINDQLMYPTNSNFVASNPGGINVLNVPDGVQTLADGSRMTADQFWQTVNKPFVDAAIARGDNIILATPPTNGALVVNGTITGFGREYQYLIQNHYSYNPITRVMNKGKGH